MNRALWEHRMRSDKVWKKQGKASLGKSIEDSREAVHIIFNISLFIVFD